MNPATTAPDLGDLLTLAAAAKRLPGRPCLATVWRWATHGILGRDGTRVRLRAVRLGRRTYVSPDALVAFGRELAEAHAVRDEQRPAKTGPRSHSAARRARDVAKAKAELARRGL